MADAKFEGLAMCPRGPRPSLSTTVLLWFPCGEIVWVEERYMNERLGSTVSRTWLWGMVATLCLMLVPFGATTMAQDSEEAGADETIDEEAIVPEEEEEEEASDEMEERLTVTGSRIGRTAFTSITPLQVIDARISREAGSIEAADILQESTAASGQQIDLSMGSGDLSLGLETYTLEDGPGSSTLNLRGLKADRTLILINGRRLAPSGVEGAPANPDLNMIVPGSLIDRFEILLDGASAIYGSDAIAGVANVILRRDFDGVEFDSFVNVNQHSRKTTRTITMTWGRDFDNGFVGVGSSWSYDPPVFVGDGAFSAECEVSWERDENGGLRTRELTGWESNLGMEWGDCAISRGNTVFFEDVGNFINGIGRFPYLFPTPDYSNVGVPGFSVMRFPFTIFEGDDGRFYNMWLDGDGDGYNDVSLYDLRINGRIPDRTIYPEFERRNLMGYGEFHLGGALDLTPYFEFQYGSRYTSSNQGSGHEIFWTRVPAEYPYNMCNPDWAGGVDCVSGMIDVYQTNPQIQQGVLDYWGGDLSNCNFWADFFGYPDCYAYMLYPFPDWEPGDPIEYQPIWAVRGDRTITEANVTQRRIVAGFRANLPFLDRFPGLSEWEVDLSVVNTVSVGDSSRPGIREDRVSYALGWYNAAREPCKADENWQDLFFPFPIRQLPLTPAVTEGCVPIITGSQSLYSTGGDRITADFSSQAERDYLFDTRDMETDIYQDLIAVYFTGGLFEVPGGEILVSVGGEYRKDEIVSTPDDVGENGLFYNFLSDRGAVGARDISEAYIEMEIPVFSGGLFRDELTFNLAGRTTNDEFFDTAKTWSGKMAWRPYDSFMIRLVKGTSFRTPNLRNLFLGGSSSSIFLSDPCYIPWGVVQNNTYDPNRDTRAEEVMENCREAGVDPTRAYIPPWGSQFYQTSVKTGGSTDLKPETSKSESVGFVFTQPWTDEFQMTFGYSYYEIYVESTIIEPTLGFLLYDCYGLRPGDSEYCQRFHRNLDAPTDSYGFYQPAITSVDMGFVNRDNESTRGYDFNMNFADDYEVFGKTFRVWVDMKSHRLLDRETRDLTQGEVTNAENDESTANWGYNRWKHRIDLAAEFDSYRALWSTRILSPIADDTEDYWDTAPFTQTCVGPPADVRCRDISDAPRYFIHSASFNYTGANIKAGVGLYNVLNTPPPKVDYTEGPSYGSNKAGSTVSNHPLGVGYDFLGRALYINFSYSFNGY